MSALPAHEPFLAAAISRYGYAALLLGTVAEGETIMVLAGFAAHRGYLALPLVMAVGGAGSLAGDLAFFALGRYRGREFLRRRPAWAAREARVREVVERWGRPLIVGFRFLYGLRTIIPFVIGTTGVPTATFVVLNAVGAAVWAVAMAGAGYLFGHAVEAVLGDIRAVEEVVFGAIALAGLALWIAHRHRRGGDLGARQPAKTDKETA